MNMSCRLLFVRHGQSLGNLTGRFLGITDLDLSPLGAVQARRTADYLKDEKIDVIYASDLIRACHTAQPLSEIKGLPIIKDKRLEEINAGLWENRTFDDLEKEFPRVGEVPFDSGRKMMSTVHKTPDGFVGYTKGAPDVVLSLCTKAYMDGKTVPMTDEIRNEIIASNKEMADKALRVLCAAMNNYEKQPENDAAVLEKNLCYIGLTGMIDPVRPEVVDAIKECKGAGIRPIMITGDHKDTAVAIAKELGIIDEKHKAITGAELNKISDEELDRSIEDYSVYARVQPEHKVRIVQAWKKKGKITAMTGDGVNDAPSIKNADIGVGMGITGTDVTKNVADMVLADDNFATIVSAVEEGRKIYDNIRNAIQLLLSSNLSEVLSIFFATMLGFTLFEPVHLLWINLITDCFPALALGLEKGDPDIMKRKREARKAALERQKARQAEEEAKKQEE